MSKLHQKGAPSRQALVLEKLFTSLDRRDHEAMAACYHPDAVFRDIAFTLRGRKQIHAMWHMISESDLRASHTIRRIDGRAATVELVADYTFGSTGRRVHNVIRSDIHFMDGLIIRQLDSCSALRWGVRALGPVKGVMSWIVPGTRRKLAMRMLEKFVGRHPEYA
jgi:ketosteroid isomerase-like protein